ncbi:MAG: family 43 glycosylhydrolase [Candidatus Dormibacteraeota bacterium]|nr:family 43 glycosylhydrolase [Candidatus Dormibacteraeota bacterium]
MSVGLTLALLAGATMASSVVSGFAGTKNAGRYTNPILATIPGDGVVQSCADPSSVRQQGPGVQPWYVYCTQDPLNDNDRVAGTYRFHLIPMLKSWDLVHFTYVGDAFTTLPSYALKDAHLFAPDVEFMNGRYYMYYTITDTQKPSGEAGGNGSAIGVATAPTPEGPWTDSGSPAVEPHPAQCCPGSRRWVFDPDVIQVGTQKFIYYGSYFGGVSVRHLDPTGLHSDPATQVQVTIANRYEGSEVVQRNGYFYLFASAANCCNGPLTGYSVFVGRSTTPQGPFTDAQGISLLDGPVGGTPVLTMNGNQFVGPGHNEVFTDFSGQDWTFSHAVDRNDPYFKYQPGFTKRPLVLNPVDWINGWPRATAGRWTPVSEFAPAAQPGETTRYRPKPAKPEGSKRLLPAFSDDFHGMLGPQWSWIRQPPPGTYGVDGDYFRFNTQAADLYKDSNNASVLVEPAPKGDYVVEVKLALDLPREACCFNFVQAGVVIYKNDDAFLKLANVAIFETRQTEWAKEIPNGSTAGNERYGNSVVGPPNEGPPAEGNWTWLRIVKSSHLRSLSVGGKGPGDDGNRQSQALGVTEFYQAYTSNDGKTWVRGAVWTHDLSDDARIGLISMGGSGFHAWFDYVHVYTVDHNTKDNVIS